MSIIENKIRRLVLKQMQEASVKNPQNEQLRLIAQTLSSAKQMLNELHEGLPEDSGMEAIIANTIKQLNATQKTFLGVKSYIK
jgi:hypothetical protein